MSEWKCRNKKLGVKGALCGQLPRVSLAGAVKTSYTRNRPTTTIREARFEPPSHDVTLPSSLVNQDHWLAALMDF